jgi:S1-C subfamily serine protease
MALPDLTHELTALVDAGRGHIARISTNAGGWRGVSGVIIEPGKIVTSSRVLRREEDLSAHIGDDVVGVELVGRDAGTDVALLSYDPDAIADSPTVPNWRDPDDLRVGELAIALARPGETIRAALGMLGVVAGPVRAHGGAQIGRYVELDRELPRGFSGALVVDADGAGIGVVVPGVFRGVTLCLPSSTLLHVAGEIGKHGHVPKGYLGVGVYPASLPRDVADDLGQSKGAAVVALEEDGPAAQAGIQVGDIIVSIATDKITSPLTLRSALLDRGGQTLPVGLLRAGKREDFDVTVGARA